MWRCKSGGPISPCVKRGEGRLKHTDPVAARKGFDMSNKLDPDPAKGPREVTPPEIRITGQNPFEPSIVRWTVPGHFRETLEAEQIIRSLTEREHEHANDSLKKLVVLLLGGLGFFALVLVLLLGLGLITMPTAFLFAVLGPFLSGILALLGVIVKHLGK